MGKRKFQLTGEQINELQGAYSQCDDGATKIRYQAVRLYGSGYAEKEVIQITGCSRRRLLAWCRNYREYGVAGLVDRRTGGNRAKLTASEVEALQNKLHQYRPNQLFSADEYPGSFGVYGNWHCCWNESIGWSIKAKPPIAPCWRAVG
jgi:transposase